MTGPASQKTNGTTNMIPFPKGLEHFPFDMPPEEVAEIMNDMRKELATIADPVEAVQFAKTRSVALLGWFTAREDKDKFTPIAEAEQIAEGLSLIRETIQATIADPVKLAGFNDDREFKFTPELITKLKQTIEIFLAGFPCNQQRITKPEMTGTSTTDHIPFPKSLEHLPFTIPLEEVAEIINDGRKLLTTVADPMYAVQWAKCVSMALLDQGKFTPPEGIAKADQITEVLLTDRPDIKKLYPCKNAKGEIIQMSIIEAFTVAPGKEAAVVKLGRIWLQRIRDAHAANVPSSPPKKFNGVAPVNPFPADEPTGLAEAFAAPKASKVPPQVAGPVVPKDDHMGRSRIYRKEKRPNLCHYRDDFYDYEGGHYAMIDDHTIEANLYSFLDKCRKQVLKRSAVGGGGATGATGATGAAAKRKATAQATIIVPFEPDMKSIHETTNALKAVGHVLPTIEQPYWLDGRTGPDPAQLICFPNGILNLSTNEFMPPEPMLFTSHGVAFDYDPNAPKPIEWLKFLKQVFDGEQDQIDSLQEMFGYCVSSDVSQEKVFMLIGPKRSGKDTIRHTLQSLISPKAVCGPTLDSMGTNFGMSAFIGKQLAIIGDMRLGSKCDKDLLAENILKLSGRGLFTIDRKHKDHWTGPLPCKLLLISNEMPKIKDTSGALASRPVIFQTRISFYGREDPHLFRDKIRPELAGILNWSLKGLWRMHQRGSITEPACSIEAREELAREGSPIMAFVQECLTLDPGVVVNKDVMYLTYLDYADHNGLHRTSKSWFFRDLATATAGKVKDERVQKDGERVHNIVGAKISNPPPKRPWNDHGIILEPAMPATLTAAADVGELTEIDAKIDAKIDAVLHATPQGEARYPRA